MKKTSRFLVKNSQDADELLSLIAYELTYLQTSLFKTEAWLMRSCSDFSILLTDLAKACKKGRVPMKRMKVYKATRRNR